jgi:hypothetical protein
MKRTTTLTIAALFGASMLATPAIAQMGGESPSQVPGTNPGTGAEELTTPETDPMIDPGTTAAVETDFESALNLVGDSETAAEISAMQDIGEVRVVHMDTLPNSDESRVDMAMGKSEETIADLQSAIESRPEIMAQLEQEGATSADVVAADIAVDNSVLVYTR